jgi:O-antigen ligase
VIISRSLRHGAVLTTLLLSPILGWNGIIVAIGIVLYQFRKGAVTVPAWSGLKLADKVVVCSFIAYFLSCVFSDIVHNPASGVWNQMKSLMPLTLAALYICSPNKIRITTEALAGAARATIATIFLLTLPEYLYFNILKGDPSYRTQLLSGNPLHISLWIPVLTALCFADCKHASLKKNLGTVAVSIFAIVCVTFFLQARASLLALIVVVAVGLFLLVRSIQTSAPGHSDHARQLQAWLLIFTVSAACVSAISFAPERVRQLILNPIGYASNPKVDSSAETRVAHWKAGLQAIENRPWSGYGASNEAMVLKDLVSNTVPLHLHAHQQFLSFGIAGGVPAIVFGTLFLLLPIIYTAINRSESVVMLCSGALSATIITASLSDSLISNKRHAAIFMILLAIIASTRASTQKASAPGLRSA